MNIRLAPIQSSSPARLALLLVAGGLVLLLAAACGDDGEAVDDPKPTPGVTDLPDTTPEAVGDGDSAPPELTVMAGDASSVAGLGSFCWSGLCADAIGYITPEEVLLLSDGELVASLASGSIAEVSVTATLSSTLASQSICTNEDGGSAGGPLCERENGLLAWTGALGEGATLPATADGSKVVIDAAALDAGTYVVSLFVRFESGGDASYGVLLDVPAAG